MSITLSLQVTVLLVAVVGILNLQENIGYKMKTNLLIKYRQNLPCSKLNRRNQIIVVIITKKLTSIQMVEDSCFIQFLQGT